MEVFLYRQIPPSPSTQTGKAIRNSDGHFIRLERETGFEPATSTLARLHSTTELFPLESELPKQQRGDFYACGPLLSTAFENFSENVTCTQNKGHPEIRMAISIEWSGKRDLNPRLQPWQGCTLPLSYSRSIGAPGRIRTPGPRLRRPLLYPTELLAQSTRRIPTKGISACPEKNVHPRLFPDCIPAADDASGPPPSRVPLTFTTKTRHEMIRSACFDTNRNPVPTSRSTRPPLSGAGHRFPGDPKPPEET